VGGDADGEPRVAKRVDLLEERGGGRLPGASQTAPRVGHVQHDEGDSRRGCRVGCRSRFRCAEVVELADRRVAGCEHLAVCLGVRRTDALGSLALGLGEHAVAPGPEVAARGATAQCALKRVAVGVHEPGQPQRLAHERRR
jgi:hypothetical protein